MWWTISGSYGLVSDQEHRATMKVNLKKSEAISICPVPWGFINQ